MKRKKTGSKSLRGGKDRRCSTPLQADGVPFWIWTRSGAVQGIGMNIGGKPRGGIPVFITDKDAKACIGPEEWEMGIRPQKISTASANSHTKAMLETLNMLVRKGMAEYVAVGRWKDGRREWDILAVDNGDWKPNAN